MDKISQKKILFEAKLKENLPRNCPAKLYEALEYSLLAGGKRLRPLLLLLSYGAYAADTDESVCEEFACALEMLHTYSLIHDDLPALDNDDLRRGRPSCHVKFGEAMAILAGDALLNLAYEIMARTAALYPNEDTAAAMYEIASASGAERLIGGQVMDISVSGTDCDEATLLYIHKNKTASLFEAALTAGGRLAGCGVVETEKLRGIGTDIGLMFQIADDIKDVTVSAGVLGKNPSDIKNNKATYVSLHGLEKANEKRKNLSDDILRQTDDLNCNKTLLREFVSAIVNDSLGG